MRRLYRTLLIGLVAGLVGISLPACLENNENAPEDALPGLNADGVVLIAYANSTPVGAADILCSGVTVGDLVVTAAHCLGSGRPLRVILDPVDLCDGTPERGTAITEAWVRPENGADIAVVQVDLSRPRTPPARPQSATWAATGWGTSAGEAGRCTSRTVELQATSGCASGESALCATGIGSNTCSGDSGSGVVDSQGRVIAITSSGSSCRQGAPGVYAKVASLESWFEGQGLSLAR
ncbi:trypsin-like serine protease [Arthrobacter sp. SW1]|uniref:trypsin-like serine protease n=1 Tax=Arthrobacter sp. SW1 TaxID=1920889 RepID=UPI0009439FD1